VLYVGVDRRGRTLDEAPRAGDGGTAAAQLELPDDERTALADGLGEHRDERIADDDDVVVANRTAGQRLAVTQGAGIDLLLLSVERALPARVAAEHRVQLPGEVTRIRLVTAAS
jgi:hypothetical protein